MQIRALLNSGVDPGGKLKNSHKASTHLIVAALLSVVMLQLSPAAVAESSADINAAESVVDAAATPTHVNQSLPVDQVHQESKFLQIPLLYMTDRQRDKNGFGSHRKNESNSILDVYCGSLNCSIANTAKKTSNACRDLLGWKFLDKSAKLSFQSEESLDKATDTLGQFGTEILKAAQKSGHNEVYVFVHGFNQSFDDAAKSAALLSYNLERPVIMYSWPSTSKVLQYFVDSGNAEWSQEHFNRLTELLKDLKEKHGLQVNVVAHSMGNRLVVRAAPVLEGKRLFENAFLVDPDFDSQTFMHYVSRCASKKEMSMSAQLNILFSHKDNALPLAQILFGGYTRLGQGADTIVESLFKPKSVAPYVMQKAKGAIGIAKHKVNGDAADPDKAEITSTMFRKELRWIDFTVLDHGIIGHSIPYSLISNLAQNSSPGPGLQLQAVGVSLGGIKNKVLSQYCGNKKQCNPLGFCEKVVFSDKAPVDKTMPMASHEKASESTAQ